MIVMGVGYLFDVFVDEICSILFRFSRNIRYDMICFQSNIVCSQDKNVTEKTNCSQKGLIDRT
jgi:hypothetical protein